MTAQVKGFAALAERLRQRAAMLAESRIRSRVERRIEARWRRAEWLWPLFVKG